MAARINVDNVANVFEKYDTILFDMDGVLWHGSDTVPGAPEALNRLRELGKRLFFVTNNSSKTRHEYFNKLSILGFKPNDEADIYCTAYVAASVIRRQFDQLPVADPVVFVAGNLSMAHELELLGVKWIGADIDHVGHLDNHLTLMDDIRLEENVWAVLVGLDWQFNFKRLTKATSYLADPDCFFYGTNTDANFPVPRKGMTLPGTGALIKAVEVACGRPPIIVGKPSRDLYKAIDLDKGLNPTKTLMIGDNIDTDIRFAQNAGIDSILVESGVSKLHQVRDTVPTYVTASVALFSGC